MKRLLIAALAACGGGTAQAPVVEKPAVHADVPVGPPPVIEWTKLVGPIKSVSVTTPDHTLRAARQGAAEASEVGGKAIDRRRLRGVLSSILELMAASPT